MYGLNLHEVFDSVDNRLISIVVPVYNEAESIEQLVEEIRQVADRNQLRFQIVFVDDGSTDHSWSKICALAERDRTIGGIRFRANAGKAAALMAGFAAAAGDLVFMMDADLQDPPEEIPRFLETMDAGFDVVTGWKRRRLDPWHKVYPSRIFNKLIGWLTGVKMHDHVCGFKCFRREVLEHIRIHGDQHRFLCVLAAVKGFRVTEIATLHRPRKFGVGKYGVSRFAKGFLDLLAVWLMTRFAHRPQHLLGVAGLATMVVMGIGAVLYLGKGWLIPLLGMLVVVPGLILMALGLIAELLVAARPVTDLYTISERVGWPAAVNALDAADKYKETLA